MRPLVLLTISFSLLVSFASSSQSDPIRWSMEGWKTDFEKTSISLALILSGGPPKDGIPSIDNPAFASVDSPAVSLAATEPVVTVSLGDDTRAYPLQILTWHEIVNDIVGGVPIAVTYCPLCNSAPVFERTVDGTVLEFGTTGKLKDSNLIMYDRATESWWQQFTGRAIVGSYTGSRLQLVPARLESWADFKTAHPDGRVLVPNNDQMRDYGRNPYVGYDSAARPFLYDGQLPDGIDPMERVVVVARPEGQNEPLVVVMSAIAELGALSVAGHEFVWSQGRSSALDAAQIAKGRDVGSVIVTRDDRLVAYDVTFAFVAHAFHPDIAMVGR